eukprot:1296223-Rhodomonas_salina.3
MAAETEVKLDLRLGGVGVLAARLITHRRSGHVTAAAAECDVRTSAAVNREETIKPYHFWHGNGAQQSTGLQVVASETGVTRYGTTSTPDLILALASDQHCDAHDAPQPDGLLRNRAPVLPRAANPPDSSFHCAESGLTLTAAALSDPR